MKIAWVLGVLTCWVPVYAEENKIIDLMVEKPLVIFVPSYNNIKYYKRNLESILRQEYSNYCVVYVDDCSNDGTGAAVEEYIKERGLAHKISLVRNKVRRGAMYNHYNIIHACPDSVIIVTLDGDDWFPDDVHVLARVNEAYQNPEVWITYGQFQEYPSGKHGFCKKMPDIVKKLNVYREYTWMTSHLRTYYAGLFKQIPVGYFIRKGSFIQSACDLAIMFAMLELSGGKALFIDEINYIYNTMNMISDSRTRPVDQPRNDHWSRSREALKPLEFHPAFTTKNRAECQLYNLHISADNVQACSDYCVTLDVARLDHQNVHIFCAAQSDEEVQAYMDICAKFDITASRCDQNSEFKSVLLDYVATMPADSYIIITVDGCLWQSSVNRTELILMLDATKAVCYSCTRGFDTQYDEILAAANVRPALVHVNGPYCIWKCIEAQGTWHNPYASQAFVITAKQLQSIINRIHGATAQQLLDNLSRLAVDNNDDVVLCTVRPPCVFMSVA